MKEKYMKKLVLIGLFASCAFIAPHANLDARAKKSKKMVQCPLKTSELKTAMRKLWEDHVTYTRNYIISALAELGDADAVAQRLMRNQDEIGNAIKSYYGTDAGDKLAKLLREHIQQAAEVVKAAKAGNKKNLDAKQAIWHANADEIATFLSNANPNWNKAELAKMLHAHLDLTTDEVVGRLKKNWEADIAAYDKGHMHMLQFSDMLIDGIAAQFPDKFECKCGMKKARSMKKQQKDTMQ